MPRIRTLSDIDVTDKKVLVRADLNVPVKDGQVTDSSRLTAFLPTLKALAERGAKIIVCSHFGRPKGKKDPTYSLRVVAEKLAELWGKKIAFAEDCIGPVAEDAVAQLHAGDVIVLENTRFYSQEEANDPTFAGQLASLADVYVNDAFSTAHRAHASTEGVAKILPAVAGLLMQAELNALAKILEAPERPVVALIGGSKISTKLDLLTNLSEKLDGIILGGGMANTFLAAQGCEMGKSLFEKDMLETARTLLKHAETHGCQILLPRDVIVAQQFEEGAETQDKPVDALAATDMALDLGPDSCADIESYLDTVHTVLWNGPLGAFEKKPFDQATSRIARKVAQLTREKSVLSVAGGGDTVAALTVAGVCHDFSYLSMAGGAFLEWLEGKTLPGVKALEVD